MKKIHLLLSYFIWVFLFPQPLCAEDSYAVVKDGTITFYFDNQKESRDGIVYSVTEELEYGLPTWADNNIKTAVFDESFSDFKINSTYGMFGNCSSLSEIVGIENLNTSEVTIMNQMFARCKSLKELDLSGFNTENVTSMEWMFYGCESLTELSLTGFDTQKVESMAHMFANCMNLKVLDISGFNTSSVSNMYRMFSACGYLETIYVGDGWNTTSVEKAMNDEKGNDFGRSMFESCFNLVGGNGTKCDGLFNVDVIYASIDSDSTPGYLTYKATTQQEAYAVENNGILTYFYDGSKSSSSGNVYEIMPDYSGDNFPAWKGSEITKVVFDSSFSNYLPTSMARWFHSCSSLTELEGIENLNTSEVNSMMSMFYGCSSLTSLDLSGFITSNVTNLYCMFYECSSLQLLDLSSFDTKNVEDMTAMFYGCSNLERVDMSSFDTRNVVNMEYLFFQCGKLTTVYAGEGWSTEKLTFDTGDMMFWDCTSLVGGEGQQCDGVTLVSYLFAKIDEPASPGYFTYKSSNPDTAIQKVIVKREKDYYYSINGQRHSTPVKGINIKNGKKYMVR